MTKEKQFSFLSKDGKTKIHAVKWKCRRSRRAETSLKQQDRMQSGQAK